MAHGSIPGVVLKRSPFFTATLVSLLVTHALVGTSSTAMANAGSMGSLQSTILQGDQNFPMVLAQATTTASTTSVVATTSENSSLMLRAREQIESDHLEIDSMAARIKEMIEARYRADVLYIKSQQTIEDLRKQIADLEQRLGDANSSFDALLAERDALTQQLSGVLAERDSAVSDSNVLAGEVDKQRGMVDALQAELASAAEQQADGELKISELVDQLGAQQVSGEHLAANLSHTEDKLKDKGRQLALAEERLADTREQLGSLRNQLADLNADRANALDEIASLRHERDTADQRANNLLSQRDDLSGKLGLFESRSNDVNSALQAEQQEHADTRVAVASLEQDVEALQGEVETAIEHRDILLEQKASLASEKSGLTAELDKVRDNLQFSNKQLEDRRAELQTASTELKDVKGQLNTARSELKNLDKQLASADDEIEKLNSHIGKLDTQIARLNTDRDKANANIHSLKSNGSNLQQEFDKATKLAASQLASAQSELETEKDKLQKQIDRRDRELLHLNGKVSELSAKLTDLGASSAEEIEGRDTTISALEAQLAKLQASKAQLQAEGQRATDTMENLHSLIASLENKEQTTAEKLAELQNNGRDEVAGLQMKLSQSEEKLRLATLELDELLAEKQSLEAEREEVFSEAEKLRIALTDELRAAKLENVTVQKARADNSIPLRLGSADFFAVGSAELTKKGGENLKKLADIISNFEDRRIVVEGHTDNVQIGYRLRSVFATNWELSVARAAAAVRHMQYQSNIDPNQLSAVGYGEYAPVASNDTADGRQLNRRVEVVLYPSEVTEEKFSAIDE